MGKSYADAFDEAVKAENVSELTREIWKPENEGDCLIGVVVAVTPFTEGKFDTAVNAYLLQTDEGLMSCVLGSATDAQVKGRELTGQLVRISYHGKRELEGGRTMNVYKVEAAGGKAEHQTEVTGETGNG